ncbi:hypothetical protein BV22DRAFT_1118398 [Leucogyrophana mollusca]|uniref:Uncharacterized protein n=1 Tax=Leucogyrophana mollusca TaxID=85980 RepID=A0ACB8BPQ2_9AGAM|nr:hypothetical protein BV22DRAFT_1118398 [Leucogyrophana mollusca]
MGEDAKFPGQGGQGIPPSPSRENPGQVYPKSDPKAPLILLEAAPSATVPGSGNQDGSSSLLGNPYLLEGALEKLEHSIGDVIDLIESESAAVGGSRKEGALLQKLSDWRDEVSTLRAGQSRGAQAYEQSSSPAKGEGMFTD